MPNFTPLLAAVLLGGEGPPSAEDVLKLAMKQRQSISKFAGTFKFAVEEPNAKKAKYELNFRIWLDGIQLRQDDLTDGQARGIRGRNCEKEGQYVHAPNLVKEAGGKVAIQFGTMPAEGKKGDHNFGNIFFVDPRVVGLQADTAGVLYHYKLDSELGRADRTAPTIEKTKWNGHDAYLVRFTVKTTKTTCAFWIVPEMDHSVVRIEYEGAGKYAKSLKCEMERYGKPGTWFPKSYQAQLVVDGKLRWRDSMELSDVKINEPIPADTFQFVGMNIPEGWPVHGSAVPFKGKWATWDGKKLVEPEPRKKKAQPKEMSAEAPDGPPRGLLLTASAGFAVVGAIALSLFFWKR